MDPKRKQEIFKLAIDNLCGNDIRSPDYLPDEDRIRSEDCYCDSCFYGKDDMALAILSLLENVTIDETVGIAIFSSSKFPFASAYLYEEQTLVEIYNVRNHWANYAKDNKTKESAFLSSTLFIICSIMEHNNIQQVSDATVEEWKTYLKIEEK